MEEIKELKYYLELPYEIEIESITEKDGGGFSARLPQFGIMGIIGDGETESEAIKDLEKIKKVIFKRFLKEGKIIPEPKKE